jgi:rhodanese-related sulfurtransferase
MATTSQTATQSLRMSPEDAKRRLEKDEAATILDARNPNAWDTSNVKMRGAIRVDPNRPHIDPAWPKDRLTLVY